jgi:hypothetical protein
VSREALFLLSQKGKSTTTANISMLDTWQRALEGKNSVGVLMFDLSAAFDLLDHNILLRKLINLNFEPHSAQYNGLALSCQKEHNKSKLVPAYLPT